MILVIDNYDSFTFNLVQLLGHFTQDIVVRRNDEIDCPGIEALHPERILISPGPGRPEDAGVTIDAIRRFGPRIPVLGVCLGHQAIGEAFGGKVVHAPSLMHGRTSRIRHHGVHLFEGVPDPFTATRYHSLVIEPSSCPEALELTAWTEEGVIMGVRHVEYPVYGVQFHPESILTEAGDRIVHNWLQARPCS